MLNELYNTFLLSMQNRESEIYELMKINFTFLEDIQNTVIKRNCTLFGNSKLVGPTFNITKEESKYKLSKNKDLKKYIEVSKTGFAFLLRYLTEEEKELYTIKLNEYISDIKIKSLKQ